MTDGEGSLGSFLLILLLVSYSDRQSMGIRYIEVYQGKRQEYYTAIANVSLDVMVLMRL